MGTALAILLLLIALLVGWLLTLLGGPGNWLMLLASAVYYWLGPASGGPAHTWVTLVILASLATVGEVLELVSAVFTSRRAGATRRSAGFALLGSIVGAIVGLFVSLPIPLIGWVIGPILFAALGAMTGTIVSEEWRGRPRGETLRIGTAAFWGRVLGSGAKLAVGTVMVLVAVVALIV